MHPKNIPRISSLKRLKEPIYGGSSIYNVSAKGLFIFDGEHWCFILGTVATSAETEIEPVELLTLGRKKKKTLEIW